MVHYWPKTTGEGEPDDFDRTDKSPWSLTGPPRFSQPGRGSR